MTTNHETGHAKNVASFQVLENYAETLGTKYQPAQQPITLPALKALDLLAMGAMTEYKLQSDLLSDLINQRKLRFKALKPYCTRILGSLKAAQAEQELLDDAKGYIRKLTGKRAASIEGDQKLPEQDRPTRRSTSQTSFDNLIEHFKGLIAVVKRKPDYQSNEPDLKLSSIESMLEELINLNLLVGKQIGIVENARINRDKVLYAPKTGMVDIAGAVKAQILTTFGHGSPQHKFVTKIQFKAYA